MEHRESVPADPGSETVLREAGVEPCPRSPDNVWAEVAARSRVWQMERTPIFTLSRNVRNRIVGVTDNAVLRFSDDGKGETHTPIPREQVLRLWSALCRDGEVGKGQGVLRFTYALLQRAIDGIRFEPDHYRLVFADRAIACRPFRRGEPEVPGLGPIIGDASLSDKEHHDWLTARVKDDPVGTTGQRLAYVSEALTTPTATSASVVAGDRLDLLMKDDAGNYVVIRIEPTIGPDDHEVFRQAVRYAALVAEGKDFPVESVRRMVLAGSIHPDIGRHYRDRTGIESFEVTAS